MKKFIIVLLLSLISVANADEPLPPPETYTVLTENKKYLAEISLEDVLTTVFKIEKDGKRKKLWQILGWFRWASLSNDGLYLGIPFWRGNLLPQEYRKEQVVFQLVKEGKLICIIRLNELIENFDNLIKTASHYYWGSYKGFNNKNEFVIETVEKNRFVLDLKTGKLKK